MPKVRLPGEKDDSPPFPADEKRGRTAERLARSAVLYACLAAVTLDQRMPSADSEADLICF